MLSAVDEEAPWLSSSQHKSRSSLPWPQFPLVLFLKIADPMALQVFYPLVPQLVRDIGITHGDESKVGYYTGLIYSLPFVTHAMMVLYWSSLSDRIGRKPVILIGMFGVSLSMYCFGLSKTFWGLIASRCLGGTFNSNVTILKTVIADITDQTNIAQAFAYAPAAWTVGQALGSLIGGSLSRPAEQFPSLFGNIIFLKIHPYFLPCAVPATFAAFSGLVTFLYFKETAPSVTSVARLFKYRRGYSTIQGDVDTREQSAVTVPGPAGDQAPSDLRSLLTPRVIIAVGAYTALSLVDMAFIAIQPLFFSTPIAFGGLGLPPSTIGKLLSLHAVIDGIFQVFFFARIHEHLGSKKTYQVGLMSMFFALGAFPLMSYLAKKEGLSPSVWILIIFQVTITIGTTVSGASSFIFITEASPNRASLGATHGLSQVLVSITNIVAPAATNSLFSLSLSKNYLGGYLVYYVLILLVCFAMMAGSLLPRKPQSEAISLR